MDLGNHQYKTVKGSQSRRGWEKRSYKKLVHEKDCTRCVEEKRRAQVRKETR